MYLQNNSNGETLEAVPGFNTCILRIQQYQLYSMFSLKTNLRIFMQIVVWPDIVKKRTNEIIKMKNTNTGSGQLPRWLGDKWSLLLHTYESRQILQITFKDLYPRILKLSRIFPLQIRFLISILYIMWCCCIQSSMNHAFPHSWSYSLVDGSQWSRFWLAKYEGH